MLKIFLGLLLIGVAFGDYNSPVLLWGVNSPAKPALQTVQQEDFANLIAPLLKTHSIVVFQEEHLASRDFLCHKDETSESCYAQLQGFSPKSYYASVQNPAEALRSLTEKREYNIVDSTGKLQAPLNCEAGKVTFISFDDVSDGESRAKTLAAHDAAISEITENLSKCKVVFLYMSTPTNSAIRTRSRRDTSLAATSGTVFRQGNQFLIFWQSMQYNDGTSGKYVDVTMESISVKNVTENAKFSVTMTSSASQTFSFDITLSTDGYYTMNNVQFDGKNFYTSLLTAPTTFSYHCGNLTINTIPSATSSTPIAYLRINSFQFQAPFDAKYPLTFKFGDSWDCVPFFTPAILSGLFVVILLLAITFTGICWMVDINTMDRFDDPKGKTITINASE